jgi:hypothetical protein
LEDRKLRLFACACCRRIWHLLDNAALRNAVEVSERFADGHATDKERREAFHAACLASLRLHRHRPDNSPAGPVQSTHEEASAHAAEAATGTVEEVLTFVPMPGGWSDYFAKALPGSEAALAVGSLIAPGNTHEERLAASKQETAVQAHLFRDIVDNPFRAGTPFLSAWRTSTVLAVAQVAYEERDLPAGTLQPYYLAILADALEEAGCTDQALLDHLRGHSVHVPGCWALDAIRSEVRFPCCTH